MFNIPMDITSYTRVQDGITSRANQCLNLYLLKRDKYKFWWILQLPAYQHQRGSAGFVITACLLLFWQWWWCYCCCCYCCCCCRRFLDHVGQLLLTLLTLYFCHPFSGTGEWINNIRRKHLQRHVWLLFMSWVFIWQNLTILLFFVHILPQAARYRDSISTATRWQQYLQDATEPWQ